MRIGWAGWGVAVIALANSGCLFRKSVAKGPYQRAYEAYTAGISTSPPDRGRLKTARAEADAAIQKDPTDARARLIGAMALLATVRADAQSLETWQPGGPADKLLGEFRAVAGLTQDPGVAGRVYVGIGDLIMLRRLAWRMDTRSEATDANQPVTTADELVLRVGRRTAALSLKGTGKTLSAVKTAIDQAKAAPGNRLEDVAAGLVQSGQTVVLEVSAAGGVPELLDESAERPNLLRAVRPLDDPLIRRALAQISGDFYWTAVQIANDVWKDTSGATITAYAIQRASALDAFVTAQLAVAQEENALDFRPSPWTAVGQLRTKAAKGELPDYSPSAPITSLLDPATHAQSGQVVRAGVPANQQDAFNRSDRAVLEETAAHLMDSRFLSPLVNTPTLSPLTRQVSAMHVGWAVDPVAPPYDRVVLRLSADGLLAAPAEIYSFTLSIGDKTIGASVATNRRPSGSAAPPAPIVVRTGNPVTIILHAGAGNERGAPGEVHLYLDQSEPLTFLGQGGTLRVLDGFGTVKVTAVLRTPATLASLAAAFSDAAAAAGDKDRRVEALDALRDVAGRCVTIPMPHESFECSARTAALYQKIGPEANLLRDTMRREMDKAFGQIGDPEHREDARMEMIAFDMHTLAVSGKEPSQEELAALRKRLDDAALAIAALPAGNRASLEIRQGLLANEFRVLTTK